MTTVDTTLPTTPSDPTRMDRVDAWCERIGDALNPILVKETRQALKSRQFVGTFSVLLVAALAWTIIGSLSMMPQIYTSPSAPRMLIGYYLVLALPMLIVVPLAAFRSLEGEIDDGTLELLSITVLSPWQIVLGKLASAMLQMLLYFVALFPCVAYAYTLRGVDLPTTLLMMGMLLVAGVVLTIVALFMAPLARTRTGRITTLLAVMMLLLGAEWMVGFLVIGMILEGNPLTSDQMLFVVTATIGISITAGHLLLTATAGQLTPESENRSTHLRVSLMILSAVVAGLGVLGVRMLGMAGFVTLTFFAIFLAGLWTLCSAMIVAESSVMTPRIRRELPNSLLARATLTWLTPGPASGLVFSVVNIVVITTGFVISIDLLGARNGTFGPPVMYMAMRQLCVAYAAYLIIFLVGSRWLVALIRTRSNPRVEVGVAAVIALAMLSALIPYAVGLHFNDYRSFSYSGWQITNWAWTLAEIGNRGNLDTIVSIVVVVAALSFFASVLLSPSLVMPRRIATPELVKAEKEG
ncbi:ABC-2 family transporter protein [Rubripirellula lacrimiformis]|uniref:ABC-2 family transporter protein n=1 Tax=Rubripirellula lacrimiformis TaxID=1930273 RepID=A0A517NFT4_9BACT|nr:ABC transporter permease [Rubripirellula lacrimiformis]QDT05999.1 ABC-2 family transporter protein [Rubripirellula lacrimiformis]